MKLDDTIMLGHDAERHSDTGGKVGSQWQVQMKRCWKKGCPTAVSGGSAPALQEGEPRAGKNSFEGLNAG